MADDARRSILEAVAAGNLSPTDAAEQLTALADDQPEPFSDGSTAPGAVGRPENAGPGTAAGSSIARVRVEGKFRSIEVVGDDEVLEAVAEGEHRSRREGDVLVIDSSPGDDEEDDTGDFGDFGDWFQAGSASLGRRHILVGGRNIGSGSYKARPLRVRMNPDLELDARVEAGPLVIKRVRGPITARVSAGPLTITGFESPIDLKVAAGKVTAKGRIDHGDSHIDCDAGKVTLHLERGSHARVRAQATLGKVGIGDHQPEFKRATREIKADLGGIGGLGNLHELGERLSNLLSGAFSDSHEVTVGKGTGSIEIQVSMGAADITFDDDIRTDPGR